MDITTIVTYAGNACYGGLAIVGLWGLFCVVLAWRRIGQIRFHSEQEQNDFLDRFDERITAGDFDAAADLCKNDPRAVPQLAAMAVANRTEPHAKIRAMVVDRFQRDVLAELEHRVSWINTMTKSAPMLGLYGTVLGMMGAFGQLAASEKVSPMQLAGNISLALVTTALGLTIAIPLIIATNSINLRIRKLEELVGYGLARVTEGIRLALSGK
jgi:biopolymer transport protein ExbB